MQGLEWKRAAIDDLLEILDFISDDNPEAALRLKQEIDRKVSRLSYFPKAFRVGRVDGTREMVVGNHYIVVYQEHDGALTILRILHTSKQWPSR